MSLIFIGKGLFLGLTFKNRGHLGSGIYVSLRIQTLPDESRIDGSLNIPSQD